MKNPCLVPLAIVFLNLGFALPCRAGDAYDLNRLTPVPHDQPIPIQDFFRPPLITHPRLNGAGTHVAAIITENEDHFRLISYELKTKRVDTLELEGDKDIHEIAWLGDRRILFGISSRKLYGIGHYAVDLDSIDQAFPLVQYYGTRLVGIPRNNQTVPLLWASHDSSNEGRDLGVIAVNSNLKSGDFINLLAATARWNDLSQVRDENDRHIVQRLPAPREDLTVGYLSDRDGNLAFAFTEHAGVFVLRRWTGSAWEKCPVDLDKFDFLGVGNTPGQIVVLTERQPGKPRALRFMDASTGELGSVLLEDPAYDFNGWLYRDSNDGRILGAKFERNGPQMVWFDETYAALQKAFNKMFPGLIVEIHGSDRESKVFLLSTFSDRQPASFHWVNLETRQTGLIRNSAPWIDPQRMQVRNIIKYKTRDGHSLDAYLTLPAGATKTNPPPLVVFAHGGPWARDGWDFDPEAQFLASRGYAVLQPNYRGSTGYGWMFPEEDDWAFRKMHDDVTDCVRFVAASGRVDPKRIAIAGGSFGGYLAVSGVVNEPDLYRCAVTLAGVFDWAALMKDQKYYQYSDARYARMRRRLGDPAKEKEKFDSISPLHHVDQIKVPILVAHGTDDQVVDVSQSKRLIAEFKKYGTRHEVFLANEEGHGMYRLKDRIELNARIEAFLDRYLKPLPASGPSPQP